MSRRRARSRRNDLPTAIQLVMDGEEVPHTPENEDALISAVYFDHSLDPETHKRASAVLRAWRDAELAADRR